MIDWLSLDDLEAHLETYPPAGLTLCACLQGQTDEDPAGRIARASEEDVLEGIAVYRVWGGLVDTIPFSIRTASLEKLGSASTGHGVEVWFPVFVDEDRPMFEVLTKLPLSELRVDSLWIDTPRWGRFGVARKGQRPMYTSNTRSDAVAAMQLLNGWHPGQFTMIDVDEESTDWFVVGPITGRFVSSVDHARDEETARQRAASYSAKRGAHFDVRRSLP